MSLERARALALRIASEIQHVLPRVFNNVVQIASTSSPSSAFNKAMALAQLSNLLPQEALGVAKLARWLAVVRRDYGDPAFRSLVAEVASVAGALPPGARQPGTAPAPPPQISAGVLGAGGIVPGIYRFGNYNWLGEVRVEKIAKFLEVFHGMRLPKEMQQLALEVFHSLYLVNTELHPRCNLDEALKLLAEITEPIREDGGLRKETAVNEMLSIKVSADIIAEILKALRECSECKEKGLVALLEDGQMRERVAKAVGDAIEKTRQGAEKDKEVLEVIGGFSASKVGHKISFEDKVELFKLLRDKPVFVRTVLEAIKTVSEERGRKGGTIEFAGYRRIEDYGEVAKARATEYAYPEVLFPKRLATKELQVRKYEEGTRGKKRKYVVMIDKSGSMEGEKILWAKAVASSLLLLSDVDDVKVAFFDERPYPEKPIELAKKPAEALKAVLSVRAEGGTSIDSALEYADENAPGYTTVLITDGADEVRYAPKNDLITIMVEGDNETLKKASKAYVKVEELTGKIARVFA